MILTYIAQLFEKHSENLPITQSAASKLDNRYLNDNSLHLSLTVQTPHRARVVNQKKTILGSYKMPRSSLHSPRGLSPPRPLTLPHGTYNLV